MRQKRRNRFMSRSSTVEEAGNKKNGGLHELAKERENRDSFSGRIEKTYYGKG